MSQESAEVVKRAYDAWHRSGLDAFMDYWAEDARWHSIEGAPDDRGEMRGRSAVRDFIEDWFETFAEFRVDLVKIIRIDEETVVAELSYGGRTRQDGVELPGTPMAAIFVVRNGRIVDGGEFETRAQALEAAGAG